MPIKKIIGIALILLVWSCSNPETAQVGTVSIIPKPNHLVEKSGVFIINAPLRIKAISEFKDASNFLEDCFRPMGVQINQETHSKVIHFTKDSTIQNREGYLLDVAPNSIDIKAQTNRGAFYAVQTLLQLFPSSLLEEANGTESISIPCLYIEDSPSFPYRGMHLDVSRHFFPPDFIKKYIDALAMLKMNTFHWHLTDDQGWRIEIKKYPKLQEISAYRDQTLLGHYSDQPHQFDGQRYGGFYTQEEIKDIVAYAQKRQITVIPEIEMPGHSQAAIAAYPELSCQGKEVEVAQKWGVFETIYCTKETTFDFLQDVLDEVMVLFPSEYIHIGGDEAPKIQWQQCPDCQKRIKDEGLKDEQELQSYFIKRIETYLNSKGRQIIGWDEILEGGLAPNATVMSWRGTEGAIKAARQKHNVIMTPTSHCYFDYYQSDDEGEPLAIGGYLPLEKVYAFNPIPGELSEEESEYILGAQGNVWTEYISTTDQVEYMVFPRILAMSEVVWTQPELMDYPEFTKRVEFFNKRLEALNYNYANHFYNIKGELTQKHNNLLYHLDKLSERYNIYYTTDGSTPQISEAKIYREPIRVESSMPIKAITLDDSGKAMSPMFSEDIQLHKAVGKSIRLNVSPNQAYAGSGPQGLINGISGSDRRFGDKEWLGFWGEDLEITIDLGESMPIQSVSTRFFQVNGQWIYLPKRVQIELFDSKGNSVTNGRINLLVEISDTEATSKSGLELEGLQATVITLYVENYGTIPDGKQGAGLKAWTFIDEIYIK